MVNWIFMVVLATEWFELYAIVLDALLHKTTYLIARIIAGKIFIEIHSIDRRFVSGRGEVVGMLCVESSTSIVMILTDSATCQRLMNRILQNFRIDGGCLK